MASARKKFNPAKNNSSEREVYKEFMDKLLTGAVNATKLVDGRTNGKADLEYDDPNG